MAEAEIDADLAAIVPALLRALETLSLTQRQLGAVDLAAWLDAVGEPEAALADTEARLAAWPSEMEGLASLLNTASDCAREAFKGLRLAAQADDLRVAFPALRHGPRALEALYPLTTVLEPVSRFFLPPERRADTDLLAALQAGAGREGTGVFHLNNEPGDRGGASIYVPETYDPNRPAPLVVALHGGSGHGGSFLWTWLRDCRAAGAILISPTAAGGTWAIQGRDVDTPALRSLVEAARQRWTIDPRQILLTGMSDGGTFTLVSGLEAGSPFTHLAPVASAFHPMLLAGADPEHLRGLPVFLCHGVLDWMFPIDMARQAARHLIAAGARLRYEEPASLSHTYPREMNGPILEWLATARRG